MGMERCVGVLPRPTLLMEMYGWSYPTSGSVPAGQPLIVIALPLIVFIGDCMCDIVFCAELVVSPEVTLSVY